MRGEALSRDPGQRGARDILHHTEPCAAAVQPSLEKKEKGNNFKKEKKKDTSVPKENESQFGFLLLSDANERARHDEEISRVEFAIFIPRI